MTKAAIAIVAAVLLPFPGLPVLAAAADAPPVANGTLMHPNPIAPPYASEVAETPWGYGHAGWPPQLFWEESLPKKDLPAMRGAAEGLEKKGRAPLLSAVRWVGTYEECKPGGRSADKPGWREWGKWLSDRPELFARLDTGDLWGSIGSEKHEFGHVSPVMPLEEKDWPAGVNNATYGDWMADRLARLCAEIGCRGFYAADFIEGIPYETSDRMDFNPRILGAFEKYAGIAVPGATVQERAAFIKRNCFVKWNDFWCEGYAKFYGGTCDRVKKLTGKDGVCASQTHFWPARRRWMGTDHRLFLKFMKPHNMFQVIELQSDDGRNCPPRFRSGVVMGQFACREPDFVLGAQMSADHEAFWAAVRNTKRDLSGEEQKEWGRKFLKNHWLDAAWVHTAGRDGSLRRASQLFHRQYWDAGKVDPKVEELFRGVRPVRPFGFASYYSVAVERSFEEKAQVWQVDGQITDALRKGAPIGYYVSDAALPKLKRESAPAAWVAVNPELLPAAEREALERFAPVVAPKDAARGPLQFDAGACGFAFYDQKGRLVVLAGRTDDGKETLSAAVTIRGLRDGAYEAADLFDEAQKIAFAVRDGEGKLAFPLERWDTRAFAVTPKGGKAMPSAEASKAVPAASTPTPDVKAPERKAASPEAAAAWDAKLHARVGEEAKAGKKPSFHYAALGQTMAVTALDASGVLTLQGGGSSLAWRWADLTPADKKGLAAAIAKSEATADLALAAFFLMAAGDGREAEGYLKRLPESEAGAVRGAFK